MSTREALDKEIKQMFADARPLSKDELKAFGEKNREIMSSSSFKGAVLKDQMKHAVKTQTVPFDIYVPAMKVSTINVEVITDENGDALITPESSLLIDETQARYIKQAQDAIKQTATQ